MDRVAVALGSNLGDRRSHIEFACAKLGEILAGVQVSSIFETEPLGVPAGQPRFFNAAATGRTTLSPQELLAELLAIEADRGRARPFRGAPRTLDLDLILFADRIIGEADLIVPHPRFRERRFVLDPLAQVAPDWRDPLTGKTVAELLAAISAPERPETTMPGDGARHP